MRSSQHHCVLPARQKEIVLEQWVTQESVPTERGKNASRRHTFLFYCPAVSVAMDEKMQT